MTKLISLVLGLLTFFTPSLCCPKDKKQALLHFKASLLNATGFSSSEYEEFGIGSWNSSSDCCNWTYVNCSSWFDSRSVIGIDLNRVVYFKNYDDPRLCLPPFWHHFFELEAWGSFNWRETTFKENCQATAWLIWANYVILIWRKITSMATFPFSFFNWGIFNILIWYQFIPWYSKWPGSELSSKLEGIRPRI